MGYPLNLALRYMGSRKRAFVSVGTAFAMLGVTLGVAALSIVMSVTGGFQEQFREKVLGVNAHVLVLKYSIDFREYRDVMKKVEHVPGVIGVAPFIINPMMVTHNDRTATGVLLKGVDPEKMGTVLDLPKHIVEGSVEGLRKPGTKPPERVNDPFRDRNPPPLHTMDDAAPDGGKLSFLDAVRQEIAKDDAKAAAAEAGAPLAPAIDAPMAQTEPMGDVTPDGGFTSQLPTDDVLPESIDPDPCKSPEQVAKLPGVVLGRTLSKQLSAQIGDCVQITSPTIGMAYGAGGARPPIAKQFRVIALFEAGFDQYDSKLVYTDLYEAQQFYEQGDSVTGVEMKVDDIDHAAAISKEIEHLLNNSVYHTMDWKELNHGLFTALLIQQIGMSVVLALIIVVAAFTVIATLIMVVLDKKKEIALLKAIGAKDDAILRVFLYQGGIIGVVGTTLGLILGYFGCKGLLAYGFPLDPKVYFISKLPVNVRPTEFIITGVFAILICLIATIFPALYAARLRPSDGLRNE
ncbi:MAG: Lipoprotein releasing system transrane protein LolC [Myxococcaceae bacterium]|jgi:lipoprotein-releasing system permease protein|nr:Lipoprotein releasing system transrane protein LolC [Myxococcaceae bacterium]